MSERPLPIRVLVADDHPIVAEGVRRYLAPHTEIEVVGTLGTVDALLVALRHTPRVHVVVLDVQIPGMEGAGTVREVRGRGPQVVLFTHQVPDDYVARMIRAGARGYVSKSDSVTDLLDAILAVCADREWISDSLRALASRVGDLSAPHESLSERERVVFELLVDGKIPKEIGFELSLAPSTVYAHVEKVKGKLGAATLMDVVRYAERWGLRR